SSDLILKPEIALDNHLLASRKSAFDQCPPIDDLPHANIPKTRGMVRPHHPYEVPLRAMAHGHGRNRQTIATHIKRDPAVDEVARPKLLSDVGKTRLELDRAGRRVDHVVHEIDRAMIEFCGVVLIESGHRRLDRSGHEL